MMLKGTALFSLYGIFHFVGLLQARTACSSNEPICECSSPQGGRGQQYQKVDCSRRNLTALPNGIPKEVVKLYLTRNDIEDVSKLDFKNLQKLELLELAGNKITGINNGDFTDLKALKQLGLSSNKITSIDDGDFTNLEALVIVDLSNNPIKTITPKAFAGLTLLSSINLEAVLLPCGCMLRDFYNWAASYKQGGITIRVHSCNDSETSRSTRFKLSDYAHCDQTTGDGLACAGKNPVCTCIETEVTCSGKELDVFPKQIPVDTTVLDLTGNEIEDIPRKSEFKKLTKLEKLVLSANKITSIDDGDFTDLKALTELDLSANPITTISAKAFTGLSNLRMIDLSAVYLNCSCAERDFYNWTASYKPKPIIINAITCINFQGQVLSAVPLDSSIYADCDKTREPPAPPATRTPAPPATWTQCMSCHKVNALTEDECDENGSIVNCSNDDVACKMEFQFTNKGYWALTKSCSKFSCTSQQQPAPCIYPQDGFDMNLNDCCTMCCGGLVCNERYEEIKSYLKNAVFKLKLKLKDATNANPTEIQAAIVKVVNASKQPGVIQPPKLNIERSEGFVAVNATFLSGYIDTIQKSLKVAIRQGVDNDPVLGREIDQDSEIEIWTTEYCPPEETFDELKGNYSWPATKGSATSRLECRNGTGGKKAIRKCLYGSSSVSGEMVPAWDDPDLSTCAYMSKTTEALNTLTKVPITNVTVNAISKQLAAVSASAKNVADVSMTTEVIEKLVTSDAAFDQHNVENTTKNVVASISNLLDVDFNTMKGAGSARRLVTNIDTLIKKIPLNPGQEIGVVENNIALTLVDTTTGKADNGLQYGVTAAPDYPQFNDTNVGLGKRGASSRTSINLPAGLFKDKAIKKASFVGYKSDMLFELMASDTSTSVISDNKKFNTTSNSMVLAATLDQPVSGLTGSDLIDMKFEHTEKELADNPRCTWWDHAANGGNGTWSTKGCTVGATETHVTTCKCDHLTNFALLMDVYGSNSDMNTSHQQALTIISITGCTLSAVALIFTIFTYVYFRRKLLKDNPSKILMNLCTALLCLNLVFLGGTHYQVDDGACKAVAVLLHYFLIAGFTWMGVEAFYMYLALVKVFQPYFSKLILKCCLVGWGLPLVIVAVTIGVNKTDNYYLKAGQICWIRDIPFYGAIVAPVCAILVVNVIAFIMVVRQLRQLTLRKKLTKVDKAHTTTITQLRGAVSVLVLLGLTWLFAFLSIGDASLAFAYIFAILNTLQGLWIFVFYCLLKKDVQHAWMRKLICCPTPEDSRSSKGKYTLDHRNTGKALKGSEGSRNQSDSTEVTLATYKRVSTDTGQPLSLYKPVNLHSGMPGVSPCGPFPSEEDFKRRKESSSSSATTTRISSAASIKSKKSIASNVTVCTTLSSETDDTTHEKPTDNNCNTTSYENPTFSRSVSEPADQAPTGQEPSARASFETLSISEPADQAPMTEQEPSTRTEPTEDKNYKWPEVKPQTGFVDSRGFARPT